MNKFDFSIIGSITNETLRSFLLFASKWKSWKSRKPAAILLYTDGGDGEIATSIADYVLVNQFPINIFCLGKVESSGLILLAAAKERIAFPGCIFMTHKLTCGNGGWRNHFINRKKVHIYQRIIHEVSQNVLVKKNPVYLTAREALDKGWIDRIIPVVEMPRRVSTR